MNIKQIAYTIAVHEKGSLSAAAKELYVTVQAVSKAVADLERELGSDLFVRESRGVRPTPFGDAFCEKAASVLSGFTRLETFARDYEHARVDVLRLAMNTPAFPGNEIVRENTELLAKKQLGIEVTIDLATGEKGLEGLRAGEYEALITVGAFSLPDVCCRPVGLVPSGVMMRRDHPLAVHGTVSLADLSPYPVALSSWFSHANETIVAGYKGKGANLNFVDLALDDIIAHLRSSGLIFTTGIPAMGKMHPLVDLRLLTPEDTILMPICLVSMKDREPSLHAVLDKMQAIGLPWAGDAGQKKTP